MMRRSPALLALLASAPVAASAWSSPEDVVAAMDVDMSRISNIVGTTSPEMFDAIASMGAILPTNPPTMGILFTGNVDLLPGMEDYDYPSAGFDTSAGDRATLAFDLTAPQYANSFSFNFNYCSREYPEWVGSLYNDVFEVFLDSVDFDGQIVFDAFGNVVTVNNALFQMVNPADLAGTGFDVDGCTGWVTTIAPIDGGETVHLEFTVYDVGDGVWDSAVYVDNLLFSEDEPPGGGPWTGDDTPDVPMEIAFLSPKEGAIAGGETVDIYGAGFDNTVDVFFGDALATDVAVGTGGNTLTVQAVPAAGDAGVVDGGTVDIRLVKSTETLTLSAGYTYHADGEGSAPPRILAITPTEAHPDGGTEMTVSGTGFHPDATVWMGEVQVEGVSIHPEGQQIFFAAPSMELGFYMLTVQNPDGLVTQPGYPVRYSESAVAGNDDDDGAGGRTGACSHGGEAGGTLAALLLLTLVRRVRKGVR